MDDEEIRDLFASLGTVSIRRMFSGKGIYFQSVIIAIVYGDELRLKADAASAPAFEAAGSTQWAYKNHRGEVMMPYWSIPHDAFDDPDTMGHWARLAFEAGLRVQLSKPSPKPRTKPPRSRSTG